MGPQVPLPAQLLKFLPLSSTSDSTSSVAYLASPLAHHCRVLFLAPKDFEFLFQCSVVHFKCFCYVLMDIYLCYKWWVLPKSTWFIINKKSNKEYLKSPKAVKLSSLNQSIEVFFLMLLTWAFCVLWSVFVFFFICPLGWHLEMNGLGIEKPR